MDPGPVSPDCPQVTYEDDSSTRHLGDVEEVGGRACVACPWHHYQVALETGDKLYQALVRTPEGKMVPGGWQSVGVRQRVHDAEERTAGQMELLAKQAAARAEADRQEQERLMQRSQTLLGAGNDYVLAAFEDLDGTCSHLA